MTQCMNVQCYGSRQSRMDSWCRGLKCLQYVAVRFASRPTGPGIQNFHIL